MTTIKMTAQNNHYRNINECSIDYVCIGHTYRISCKKSSAIFVIHTQSDIDRMKSWIAFYA